MVFVEAKDEGMEKVQKNLQNEILNGWAQNVLTIQDSIQPIQLTQLIFWKSLQWFIKNWGDVG